MMGYNHVLLSVYVLLSVKVYVYVDSNYSCQISGLIYDGVIIITFITTDMKIACNISTITVEILEIGFQHVTTL